MGRLLKPGGAWSTKGSMQSYQDMVIRASEAATVSVAAERGPPARANSADITGSAVSAKVGKSSDSMFVCSQRATAMLSE